MLQALEREHEALYATLILPVTHYVMEALPEDQRETTKVEGVAGPGEQHAIAGAAEKGQHPVAKHTTCRLQHSALG
jgi:hypothetical protein